METIFVITTVGTIVGLIVFIQKLYDEPKQDKPSMKDTLINTLKDIRKWIIIIAVASIPFYIIMLYKLYMLLSGEAFLRTL
jgi:type II secretory pathway component PulF